MCKIMELYMAKRGEHYMKAWVDLHCDTLSALENSHLHIDIESMKKSGISLQFFACFVNVLDGNWEYGYQKVENMIQKMYTEQTTELQLVSSYKEWEKNEKSDVISALLTLEEGGILNGKYSRIPELYRKGVRLITLTWNYENCFGYPNSSNRNIMRKGLKSFGKEAVGQMNQLGMLIDVSHLSEGGFWDCIKLSKKPIVASHSNARSLCNHPRNLTDKMLQALSEKGGVAGLNFYPRFLKREGDAQLRDIAKHAKHMIQVAGEEVVAIGTDFAGYELEKGQKWISGVSEIELVWDSMKREHITERQIDKIMIGNARRVLQEVL